MTVQTDLADSLREFQTETGRSLLELVDESPVLLIFLRHLACPFCAQTLERISKLRSQIEAKGVLPVFVHLGTVERARLYFDYYNLTDVERISNPDASLYHHPAFALARNNPILFPLDWMVWKQWFQSAMIRYGFKWAHEDVAQMPGVFLLKDRRIARAFRHRSIADQPNYLKLIDVD